MAAEVTLGVITEQGDLGLGFDPVSKKDQETVQKNDSDKEKSEKSE